MSKSHPTEPIRLIMGLRNPGERYAATRHNVGDWWLETVLAARHLQCSKHKTWPVEIAKDATLTCLRATTYMNHSGEGLGQYCRYHRMAPAAVLVAYDDLDLPVGTVRLKFSGGDGGHNGVKSVISHMQTKDFWRLRIGIGRPGGGQSAVSDYVLSKPSPQDRENIMQALHAAQQHFDCLLTGAFETWMQQVHTKTVTNTTSGST